MNPYQQVIQVFLTKNPQQLGCGDIDDVLGMLYCCYHQCRGDDKKAVKEKFDQLDAVLSKLSLSDNNRVFSVIVSLCQEYQKDAFREGLLVGLHLYRELLQR